jgi:hypothetical protein
MKKYSSARMTCAVLTVVCALPIHAQNAPGEDPVVLTKRVAPPTLPVAGARASIPLESQTASPAWMKAKIARYEAQATNQADGILTDKDVTRSATSDGFKKTCLQEIGSTTTSSATGAAKPGVGNNQQIVVLKGDLVNICK